jgi:hypothetical protein
MPELVPTCNGAFTRLLNEEHGGSLWSNMRALWLGLIELVHLSDDFINVALLRFEQLVDRPIPLLMNRRKTEGFHSN